jgi:hypothetical protein
MNISLDQQRFRRGRLLQILAESNDQGASEPMLRTLVRSWGYKADADTVTMDLAWLARHGFAARREVGPVTLARITQAGRDIVSRDLDVPGVAIMED